MVSSYQFRVGDWVTLANHAYKYSGPSAIKDGPVQVTEIKGNSCNPYVLWHEPSRSLCPGAWFTSIVLVDGGPW